MPENNQTEQTNHAKQAVKAEQSESVLGELLEILANFAASYVPPELAGMKISDHSMSAIELERARHELVLNAGTHFQSKQAKREMLQGDCKVTWYAWLSKAASEGDAWERQLSRTPGTADVLKTLQSAVAGIADLEKKIRALSADEHVEQYVPFFEARLKTGARGLVQQLTNLGAGRLEAFENVLTVVRKTVKYANDLLAGEPPHQDVVLWMRHNVPGFGTAVNGGDVPVETPVTIDKQ